MDVDRVFGSVSARIAAVGWPIKQRKVSAGLRRLVGIVMDNGGPWTGKLFDNGGSRHLFPNPVELPETFSLGMLKREVHCIRHNGLPLLRHYGASLLHGRTGTFISGVQETTNPVADCFQNRHKRVAF